MSNPKLGELISDAQAEALCGLSVSLHLLRILASRGLISPNEVETIYSTMMETAETLGSETLQSTMATNVGTMMSEIRRYAQDRWIGKGEPDPEPRHA